MNAKQGVFELADDIPLTLADDPDIDLGDLLTVPHVERPCLCDPPRFVNPRCVQHGAHEYHGAPVLTPEERDVLMPLVFEAFGRSAT